MGPLGWQETIFIFVLALLIFGPKKLPELGKTIGKALTEFRRASSELKSTWDREMSAMERETESIRQVTADYNYQIQSSASPDAGTYDSDPYGDSYNYGESGASTASATTPPAVEEAGSGSSPNGTPSPAASPPAGVEEVIDGDQSSEPQTGGENRTAPPAVNGQGS